MWDQRFRAWSHCTHPRVWRHQVLPNTAAGLWSANSSKVWKNQHCLGFKSKKKQIVFNKYSKDQQSCYPLATCPKKNETTGWITSETTPEEKTHWCWTTDLKPAAPKKHPETMGKINFWITRIIAKARKKSGVPYSPWNTGGVIGFLNIGFL